jgi:hypothetical protein
MSKNKLYIHVISILEYGRNKIIGRYLGSEKGNHWSKTSGKE